VRFRELGVDELLEFVVRLSARDRDAIDERGWRSAHADAVGDLDVGGDLRRPTLLLEAVVERLRVDARSDRPGARPSGESSDWQRNAMSW
jgi:hypothetical protein